jgi:aryl-alcohol dehydrogenase-like predicted oxidoreductase
MADRVVVVTKVRALTPEEAVEDALAAKVIEQSVLESRRRLQMDCLPVVLFHNESDARHLDVLERLKTKGLVRQVGVSCNDPSGTVAGFIANPAVSALQLPCNVLDRRHQHRGVFGDAAAHEVAIFIRSVYLQGLLVMAEDRIPGPLEGVIPVRRRLAELAGEAGMTLAELALRYMLSQSGVTCILVGVETDAQVRENVAMFSRGPLANDLIATIDAAVPVLPEPILTPRLWPTLPLKG